MAAATANPAPSPAPNHKPSEDPKKTTATPTASSRTRSLRKVSAWGSGVVISFASAFDHTPTFFITTDDIGGGGAHQRVLGAIVGLQRHDECCHRWLSKSTCNSILFHLKMRPVDTDKDTIGPFKKGSINACGVLHNMPKQ
jgi:hypothetical protein